MGRALLAGTLWALTAPTGSAQEAPKPPLNLLLIVADDLRADAIESERVRTPSIDRLAREGFVFERAYCMGSFTPAVCCPSRAMLLSGRELRRLGSDDPEPPPEMDSLPALMRRSGWTTFATGKWHNGEAWFEAGFSAGRAVFFGSMGGHTELELRDLDVDGKKGLGPPYAIGKFSSTAFADAAVDFLGSAPRDRPFLCYVAFTAPHDPHTPPAEARAQYDAKEIALPEDYLPAHPFDNGDMQARDELVVPAPRSPETVRAMLADYRAMITHMDQEIGRILEALEASGRAGETLVVFTSDQGMAMGSHGLFGKQNLYEHSMRVPLVLRGPDVPRGRSRALLYNFDLLPTLCDLLELAPPEGIDGRSMARALEEPEAKGRESILTLYLDCQRAVTDGRWKLIHYPWVDRTQLFDLDQDPHETRDLSAEPNQEERVAALMAKLP